LSASSGRFIITSATARSHQRGDAFGRLALVAERHVEYALGFRIHAAGDVKARQLEPRRQALVRRRRGGEIDEMRFVREIGALAIGAQACESNTAECSSEPCIKVCTEVDKVRPNGRVTTTLSGERVTLRSSASGSITKPWVRNQRMEFDKILFANDAARRRQRGDDEQPVADVGIGDLIDVPGVRERDRDARAIGPDQIAGEIERAGRIDDGVADIERPIRRRRRRRWTDAAGRA